MTDVSHATPRLLLWLGGLGGLAMAVLLAVSAFVLLRSKQEPRIESPPVVNDDPRLDYASSFRNVRPGVRYVEEYSCAQCHPSHAESFANHPMGQSLAPVSQEPALERYAKSRSKTAHAAGALFEVERRGDRVFHKESRRTARGELFAETIEEIHYVIGSGVHTFSYLIDRDNRVVESPITYYSQKRIWDLSPGYENRRDMFERPVTVECLFCHTNAVEAVAGTMNEYRPPLFRGGYAVGCQRCHGPGELHVARREHGEVVEEVDDTIVNPRRLPRELRESVCQQCHLPGSKRILAPSRDYFDFRPGLPWQLFWSVVIRPPEISNNTFDSSVEQMYASRCFQASDGRMGCTSCHDPHSLPLAEKKVAYYRSRCLNCHDEDSACSLTPAVRKSKDAQDNCIACHMPAFPSTDIPHTAATDHRIPRLPGKAGSRSRAAWPEEQNFPARIFRPSAAGFDDRIAERALGLALVEGVRGSQPDRRELFAALQMLGRAIDRRPDDWLAWEGKAVGLAALGETKEALDITKNIVEKNPRRESALINAAVFSRMLGMKEAAASYWAKALEVNPSSLQYRTQLARMLAEQGDWSRAMEECRAALRQYPASLDARLLLLEFHLVNKDLAGARAELERVLALNPPNPEQLQAWFNSRLR